MKILEFNKNGSISLDSLTYQQSMNEHLINKISDISDKTTFGKFYNVLGPKSLNIGRSQSLVDLWLYTLFFYKKNLIRNWGCFFQKVKKKIKKNG